MVKGMYQKANHRHNWLYITIPVVLGLSLMAFLVVVAPGCAAFDKVAEQGVGVTQDPTVQQVAGAFPFGELIVGLVGTGLSIYLNLRRKQWKSAFTTVVQSVEPFIPADESARQQLKAKQGEQVTELVKSVKSPS